MSAEQSSELARVSHRLSSAILSFARSCVANDEAHFFLTDLLAYVSQQVPCAPGSPERVLRDLRAKGQLEYRCKSRRNSLYVITNIKGEP